MKSIKYLWLTIATAILLFILGIFTGSWAMRLMEIAIGRVIVVGSTVDAISFRLSLAAMLGLCPVAARVLLAAYSKNRPNSPPMRVFFAGLAVALLSAVLGITLCLGYIRITTGLLENNVAINISNVSFFSWGVGAVVLICGVIAVFSLWFSPKHPDQVARTT